MFRPEGYNAFIEINDNASILLQWKEFWKARYKELEGTTKQCSRNCCIQERMDKLLPVIRTRLSGFFLKKSERPAHHIQTISIERERKVKLSRTPSFY